MINYKQNLLIIVVYGVITYGVFQGELSWFWIALSAVGGIAFSRLRVDNRVAQCLAAAAAAYLAFRLLLDMPVRPASALALLAALSCGSIQHKQPRRVVRQSETDDAKEEDDE
ncbi:hypothetical protein [Rubinisphaera sp. JC750]|uniref:hypothetical protein n=1 Tax=Rubinisphaera sp. JC750 TaxID=2898658 RepID=UPI001F222690|nr:hypothetical protein [Rubinisphaera sp. JC750]